MPGEINRRSLSSNMKRTAPMFMSLPFTYFALPSSPVIFSLYPEFHFPDSRVQTDDRSNQDSGCNPAFSQKNIFFKKMSIRPSVSVWWLSDLAPAN